MHNSMINHEHNGNHIEFHFESIEMDLEKDGEESKSIQD